MLLFTLILHRLTWCVLSSFPSKKRKDNKSYLKYAMSVGVKCVWRVALLEASNFLKILDVVTTPYCEVYKYWPRWILIYKRLDLSYVRSMRHCQDLGWQNWNIIRRAKTISSTYDFWNFKFNEWERVIIDQFRGKYHIKTTLVYHDCIRILKKTFVFHIVEVSYLPFILSLSRILAII